MRTPIREGDRVIARSAFGERLEKRAMTGVLEGKGFPVVWVCREQEWQEAKTEGRDPEGIPWPAEDVTPAKVKA